MATAADTKTPISLRYKVARRFYEPLLLLDALGTIRGGRLKPEPISDSTKTNHTQLRRSFADTIAYICAYKKGRDNVTAAALERTPREVIIWLAANTKIDDKVIDFLKKVLAQVKKVSGQDDPECRQQAAQLAEESLISMITSFHTPRLTTYYMNIIKDLIQPCQEVLAQYYNNSVLIRDTDDLQIMNLRRWLTEHFGHSNEEFPPPSFLGLINACYNIRHTQYLKTIRTFAGQGQTRFQEFERLHKLLGKLGKPVTSSRILIDAAMNLSQDLTQGFTIKRVPSSKPMPLPFRDKEETTIKSIVGRMFSSPREQEDFMNRLSCLEDREITDFIREERFTKTRVHTELLLVDHFERTGCNFLDSNEKYIGCSKPACYLCHMYIAQHPGSYVVPACHNKLYIAWRAPDAFVGDIADRVSAAQERIILKMIETVRKDLVTEINSRTMRLPYHADSTTGITSTLDSAHSHRKVLLQDTNPDHQGDLATDAVHSDEVAEHGSPEDSESDGGVQV